MNGIVPDHQSSSLIRDWTMSFGEETVDYFVRAGKESRPELLTRLHALRVDHFVLLADERLSCQAEELRDAIATEESTCTVLTIPCVESAKSLATIESLSMRAEQEAHITVNSCLIGLGGGLVANVAGFLASIQFRGIRLIHMPTTLLSMADVVPSVKVAVNTDAGKNHLGQYYRPLFVWADLRYLDTLPTIEIQSALCELIKFILTIPPTQGSSLYESVVSDLNPDGQYDDAQLLRFIQLCVEAKCQIMEHDPHEQQQGKLFEYGHTFGHALELAASRGPHPIPHGIAVAQGMLVAARISRMLGMLTEEEEQVHHELLGCNGVPAIIATDVRTDEILSLMHHDNKRGLLQPIREDHITMVLLHHLQLPNWTGEMVLTQVHEEIIQVAIDSLRHEGFVPACEAVSAEKSASTPV